MIGQEISHYRIVEKLGEGGMGAVYKAEDTVLKRFVALKFLSAEALGSEEERARFLREAQAAAALDHPSICTVYEVGEADGRTFLSMAYLEGQTLRRKVEQQPLPASDVVRLLLQVLEGLHEAHDLGIVHRDIKSSNIMVTARGRAKIMDFGLAQLPGAARITQLGTTLGTAAYMSPEQAEGFVVDHRTDLWSVGVVLYEALTGTLPFGGDYIPALMYAIVHEQPRPLDGLEEPLQRDLSAIVSKALTKTPDQRCQNAAEMIGALVSLQEKHRLEQGSAASHSVVIPRPPESAEPPQAAETAEKLAGTPAGPPEVPFEPATVPTDAPGKGRSFGMFAAGVVAAVFVLAATWMWRMHQPPPPPSSFDVEVGAVEAPVSEAEDAVTREQPVPKREPDPPPAKVEIPAAVPAEAEATSLIPQPAEPEPEPVRPGEEVDTASAAPETTPVEPQPTPAPASPVSNVNSVAHQIATRGYALLDDRTGESARSAIVLFEQALDIDPNSALSHAGLALVHAAQALQGSTEPLQALGKAEQASQKALAIDKTLAPAHVAAGVSQALGHWNWDGAKASFDRALSLEPDNADAHLAYALAYLIPHRKLEDALVSLRRAAALKPSAPDIGTQLGRALSYAGEDDAALAQYRATLRGRPAFAPAYWAMGMSAAKKGDLDAARKAFGRLMKLKPGNPAALAGVAYVDVMSGDSSRARVRLRAFISDAARQRSQRVPRGRKKPSGRRGRSQMTGYVSPYWRALVAAAMKEDDIAFRWLEEGVGRHYPFVAQAAAQPEMKRLLTDRRFEALLGKMNLSP